MDVVRNQARRSRQRLVGKLEIGDDSVRAIGHAKYPLIREHVVILTTSGPLGTAFKPQLSPNQWCTTL